MTIMKELNRDSFFEVIVESDTCVVRIGDDFFVSLAAETMNVACCRDM